MRGVDEKLKSIRSARNPIDSLLEAPCILTCGNTRGNRFPFIFAIRKSDEYFRIERNRVVRVGPVYAPKNVKRSSMDLLVTARDADWFAGTAIEGLGCSTFNFNFAQPGNVEKLGCRPFPRKQ